MEFKLSNRLDCSEEEIFSELHHFLLRKNHRNLSTDEVIAKTGVPAELVYKWVKNGKLKPSIFPNLGYPCERCGKLTNHAKLCINCSQTITSTLQQEEKDKAWFSHIQKKTSRANTYYSK